jgi:Flp pilus assembly protein TadD
MGQRLLRAATQILGLCLALAVLSVSAWLVFRPDARDTMREAERLLLSGRYYDARAAYATLALQPQAEPLTWGRLGMVQAIRAEWSAATQTLGYAVGAGVAGTDHDLVRLYQGRVSDARRSFAEAHGVRATIPPSSPLYGVRLALDAETLLRSGDIAKAEQGFRAALAEALPPEWRTWCESRLVALLAARDQQAALQHTPIPASNVTPLAGDLRTLVAPLLPSNHPSRISILNVLQGPAEERQQLLGQLYLDAGWNDLAEVQFLAVPRNSALGPAAAAYAAYARWQAGDLGEGQRRLEQLVAEQPAEPRARALLALAYMAKDDFTQASKQLQTIQQLAPGAPDTQLALGQWYASQAEYAQAVDAYRRAIAAAMVDERAFYQQALAEFHLITAYNLCEEGLSIADLVARQQPQQARSFEVLAAMQLRCGNLAGATVSARRALTLAPTSAEAAYYLGRALALSGDRRGARQALISAADLAPASDWRVRAEQELQVLGWASS